MSLMRWALALILPYFLQSCQTGGDSAPKAPELPVSSGESAASPSNVGPVPPAECPAKVPACTKEYSPVICTFSVYAGRPLKTPDRLVTWGPNACVGIGRLYQEACKNLMQPRLISQVQCVPDASSGHCPPPQPKCSAVSKPSVCTANAYDRETLSKDQKIIANDSNECLARARLKLEACRINLDPSRLAKVYCEGTSKKKSVTPQ